METPETIYDETVMTHQEACAATLGDIFDKRHTFNKSYDRCETRGLLHQKKERYEINPDLWRFKYIRRSGVP